MPEMPLPKPSQPSKEAVELLARLMASKLKRQQQAKSAQGSNSPAQPPTK